MAIDQAQMQEYAKQWGQLVARAWGDQAFKARLLAEPAPALAEQGIPVPAGVEVRVHENSPTLVHLTLPPAPAEELSDEQLDQVAAGTTAGTAGTAGTLASVCMTVSSALTAGTAGTAG
jgi:hypothetical protein